MLDDQLWEVSAADHSNEMALQVRELAEAVATHDGVGPLNEQGLRILVGQLPGLHLVATVGDDILGYAQVDPIDGSGQCFVHPDQRRQGIGRALIEFANTLEDDLDWWSFGTLTAARELADSCGLREVRALLRMAMPAEQLADLDPGRAPEGVSVTTFTEADIDDLVELNALAFADHPEQGRMTRRDVEDKMAEDWFNPEGLFLARDESGTLVGFHWTKILEAGQGEDESPSNLVGEVYVIGVHPFEAGRGVGRHLLNRGLRHLFEAGVANIELYVEAANERVVTMYERAGFSIAVRDTRWG